VDEARLEYNVARMRRQTAADGAAVPPELLEHLVTDFEFYEDERQESRNGTWDRGLVAVPFSAAASTE
jgi:hypothetical protein